jgi:transcriptional regulator with XRE-family HTH domain
VIWLNKVKELRLAKHMTKKELSEKSGVSVYLINRIENEEIFPLQTTMVMLSHALNEDTWKVFNFDLGTLDTDNLLKKPKKGTK